MWTETRSLEKFNKNHIISDIDIHSLKINLLPFSVIQKYLVHIICMHLE